MHKQCEQSGCLHVSTSLLQLLSLMLLLSLLSLMLLFPLQLHEFWAHLCRQWDDESGEPTRLVGFDASEPTAHNQVSV
jgi:hypothetical protein